MSKAAQDQWARWVLDRQFADDPQAKEDFLKRHPIRDKVLDNAQVA